ncbi:sigma-70 family RNA polymerase sigma factor [Streptomyces cyaneofuscatus]|uniref:sigma-70 family RNA polymerase sigma factor n=1 Tax=Streptomyces cyaneofuscatus TaxID=66883 RepID=UPI002953764C|nr:sigma-70 family RNA polymerase sigma factor [Streptomyces cyaneofuscatus]WOP09900.1 sigma-70 family RNA polymerase sigma factor [Streptomyces cyaneofuscatus]
MSGAHPADPITEAFEEHRARLTAVAYRVLGSHADADDAVQEAWLRLSRQDAGAIDNLGGWLTTVVGRISLDLLRSGRTRRTVPLDDRLTDLARQGDFIDFIDLADLAVTIDRNPDPEDLVALGDSIGLALLTVLDSLRPDERLAFVLHDVFAVPHGETGAILGKSADATKMLTSRARRKVRAAQHPASARRRQREVVQAFLAAARDGRFEQLLQVLHPEVKFTVHSPNGRFVTLGATEVATRARVAGSAARGHTVTVNGRPGVISWSEDGTPLSLLAFTVADGRITGITALIDPARLALMDLPHPV